MRYVNPDFAVILCGKNNTYGHPDKEIIDRLDAAEIPIYRTDELGTIIIESDGDKIEITNKPTDTSVESSTEISSAVMPSQSKPLPEAEIIETIVYITKSGDKYHEGSCSSLSQSKIEISLDDTKSRGYDPCSRCNP